MELLEKSVHNIIEVRLERIPLELLAEIHDRSGSRCLYPAFYCNISERRGGNGS